MLETFGKLTVSKQKKAVFKPSKLEIKTSRALANITFPTLFTSYKFCCRFRLVYNAALPKAVFGLCPEFWLFSVYSHFQVCPCTLTYFSLTTVIKGFKASGKWYRLKKTISDLQISHNLPIVQTTSLESFRCFLVSDPGRSSSGSPSSPSFLQSWTLHNPSWDRWRSQPGQLLLIQSEWGQILQLWGWHGHSGHSKLWSIPLGQKQLVQESSLSVPINEIRQSD